MSEFSESYHLEADDQHDGLQLLQRANLDGFVFPPQHAWGTIIPSSEVGAAPPTRPGGGLDAPGLHRADPGLLLRVPLAGLERVAEPDHGRCQRRGRWAGVDARPAPRPRLPAAGVGAHPAP